MKLLLDENLSPQHAVMLRELGHDAVGVVEVGLSGFADDQVRAFAIESDRVLLTLDADFANILRFPPAGTPGVIRFKIHPPTEDGIRGQIQQAVRVLENRSLAGCLAVCPRRRNSDTELIEH